MKVLVIDNAEQLAPLLFDSDVELLCFADEIQALNAAEQHRPELIFLDYAVLGDQTPEYIRLLLDASDGSKLVVIGNNIDEDDIFHCLLTGAQGYQDIRQLAHYVDKLIKVIMLGEAWVSRKMVARVLEAIRLLDVQNAIG